MTRLALLNTMSVSFPWSATNVHVNESAPSSGEMLLYSLFGPAMNYSHVIASYMFPLQLYALHMTCNINW